MRLRLRLPPAGVVVAAALVCGPAAHTATTAAQATPGPNGRLLVATGQRHDMGLYALQPRTGDRHMLIYGGDQGATYSPDGTRIAFMNNYDGDYEICVMNADGTGIKPLTRNSAIDAYPTWSPDGKRIAFTSNRDGDFDIWVMNADGTAQVNLTNDDPSQDDVPHWSPDGRWIAYQTNRYDGWNVALMSPDGKYHGLLGWSEYATEFDSWSPDGKSVLVDSNRQGDFDLYRYDIPDTDPIQWGLLEGKIVSDDSAVEGAAVWSPDGKQIAFSSNRDGDFEVYVMSADGGPQRQLTHNNVDDIVMDWQALHDLRAPSVKALPSSGKLGKAITLRFRASDDSGRASVGITVYWGKRPVDYLHTPLRHRSAGHTYTASWHSYRFGGPLRFCAEAYDPSGNESARSCARIQPTS
jgi:Tol biopolymer transport system component